MLRKDLAKFVKKVDRGFNLSRSSNMNEHIYHGGKDALFYYSSYVCAIPPGNIYRFGNTKYTDSSGVRHRGLEGLLVQMGGYVSPNKIRLGRSLIRCNQ